MTKNWMDWREVRCKDCGRPLGYAYKNAFTTPEHPIIQCPECAIVKEME